MSRQRARVLTILGLATTFGACNPGGDSGDTDCCDVDNWSGTGDTADQGWGTGEPPLFDTADPGWGNGEPPLNEPDDPAPGTVVHNPWVSTANETRSTFSVDVDQASFSYGRRLLMEGRLPAPSRVRVEEWINAMTWHDAGPEDDMPFAIHLDGAPSRFDDGDDLHLLRIGLQAVNVAPADREQANLVFLVDVSGSMSASDKLPLVQHLLDMLVGQLQPTDTLSIVTYASQTRVALPPTPVTNAAHIRSIISTLRAAGSTAGGAGLDLAYDQAEAGFVEGGINRVFLCTDGDFNVGVTGEALVQQIVQRAEAGIDLTALGFGTGNLNDPFLEDLTNEANGSYGYIGDQTDAEEFIEAELVGALQVVARDAKVQVHFEQDTVERWRLIGYANRILEHDDFDDDDKDAGDIGAGHHVTALYEVELTGTEGPLARVDLRHQPPEGGPSTLQSRDLATGDLYATFDGASADLRAGAAVAELAEILAHSPHAEGDDFPAIRSVFLQAWPLPRTDRQDEFLEMASEAENLWP